MAKILIPSRRVWTRQPQRLVGIDWSNSLTRGLEIVICPSMGLFNAATSRRMVSGQDQATIIADKGAAFSWSRSTPNPINTGYANSGITAHSCFALVKHRELSSENQEQYLNSRVSANNGFGFYSTNATGTYPSQTFFLGYVHGGVAAYDSTVGIFGGNTRFIPVGFSAVINGNLRYFARGINIDSKTIGGINQSSDTLRVGYEVVSSYGPANYDLSLLAYWSRELSDSEHEKLAENPWQIFAKRDRIAFINTTGGSASYTITPTGSISLSGISTQIKNKIFQASVTVNLTGSASLSLTNGAIEYTISPTGSITYSGTYKARVVRALSPSGTITYSGNAIRATTHIQTSSGLITFSGNAPLYIPGSYIPTTSILLTGVGK